MTPWHAGEPLPDDQHQLWCRRDGLWTHEILFEDIRDEVLYYRRDPSITMRVAEAIRHTDDGIPYIAPHLQLLYKAKNNTQRDQIDRAAALPLLTDAERAWLGRGCPS
jgi:hypothetical protein